MFSTGVRSPSPAAARARAASHVRRHRRDRAAPADHPLAHAQGMPRQGLDNHHRGQPRGAFGRPDRSEEHTSELQSLMRISYAVFCLKKKIKKQKIKRNYI